MDGLYNFWLVDRKSGLCFIDISFENLPENNRIDGNLVGGLLTSYLSFTNELVHENIKLFETENFKIIFAIEDDLYMAVLVDSSKSVNPVERVLLKLIEIIKNKYPINFEGQFDGDFSVFDKIESEIETVLDSKPRKVAKYILKEELSIQKDKFTEFRNNVQEKRKERIESIKNRFKDN